MTLEVKQAPIIDHVPTAEELRHDPHYVVRSSMSSELGGYWGEDVAQDAVVLDRLGDELTFAELTGDRVASLYDVSRHVGDMVIADDPEDGAQVYALIDSSRWYARPRTFDDISEHHRGSAQGTHNERTGLLTQDLAGLVQTSRLVFERMKADGQPLKEIKHAYLATYLAVAAHESGHALLAGVSAMEKSLRNNDAPLLATSMFLAKHPEIGFTGNWRDDVIAHEERFAEGYAHLVVAEALRTLGYPDEVSAHLLEIIKPDVTGKNNWEKGYTAPLTKKEVVAQLADIHNMMTSGEGAVLPDAQTWKHDVANNQLEAIKQHVEGDQLVMSEQQQNETLKRVRTLKRMGHMALKRVTAIIRR